MVSTEHEPGKRKAQHVESILARTAAINDAARILEGYGGWRGCDDLEYIDAQLDKLSAFTRPIRAAMITAAEGDS